MVLRVWFPTAEHPIFDIFLLYPSYTYASTIKFTGIFPNLPRKLPPFACGPWLNPPLFSDILNCKIVSTGGHGTWQTRRWYWGSPAGWIPPWPPSGSCTRAMRCTGCTWTLAWGANSPPGTTPPNWASPSPCAPSSGSWRSTCAPPLPPTTSPAAPPSPAPGATGR